MYIFIKFARNKKRLCFLRIKRGHILFKIQIEKFNSGILRKRICATTCYLNPSEKDCFLAKMSEISGFDAIIFRIFKYIAFR